MSEYGKVFWEPRYEIWKVSFLNAFLSAAIAFFISNVVCTIIKISVLYSLIPALLVFTIGLVGSLHRNNLRRIEEANPEVAEILRTAHDNSGTDDLMVHALFLELMEKMETVTAGVFIDGRKTTMKLLVIAVLAFTPLLISAYAPSLTLENPLVNLPLPRVLGGGGENIALAPTGPIAEAGERDITGDTDILNLGNEKLDISASSGSGGIDFSTTGDAQNKPFRYNDYPTDVQAEQTDAGTARDPGSDADLINDFNCKSKKTC